MKQLFSFMLLAAVVITSCNASGDPNNFTVSGRIEHAPSQKVFLEQVNYDNTPPKVVDSGKLAQDGGYKLKAIAKEQSLFLLTIDHKPVFILINDNNDIRISTDLNKNLRSPYISNSSATKSLYDFLNNFRSKDSILSGIYAQIDTLYTRNPNDSSIVVLQTKGAEELQTLVTFMKEYIQKSNSPAAVFYALNVAASKNAMSMNDLETLAGQASERFKEHSGLAVFKSLIAQANAANSSEAAASWINKQAPDLTMNDVNGNPVSISNFKGKYVLVDFWASWCRPCRAENPNVVTAYNKFKNKNFTILGVSLDQNKDAWVQAIKNDGLTWTHMSDLKYWESAAVSTYKFQGIPYNILIDPSGKVIGESLRGPTLEQKLEEILK
jgi:peroxiredoxin